MKLQLKTIILPLLLSLGLSAQQGNMPRHTEARDSLLQFTKELAYLQPRDAIKRVQKLQQQALQENDSLLLADALSLEATAHFRLYNFRHARDLLYQAFGIYQQLNDRESISRTYTKIAETEAFTGSYYQALIKLEKALEISEDLGNRKEQVEILFLLARIRYHQEEIDQALHYAQRSLSIANSINDKAQRGKLYNLLAKVNLARGEIKSARGYLENALVINRSMGNDPEVAESYATEARIALDQGNLKKALEDIQRAINISRESGFPYQYAEHLLIHSEILLEAGREEQALEVVQTADSISGTKTKIQYLNRSITRQLAKTYMLTGDSARALTELLAFNKVNDSIREFDFQKMLLLRDMERQKAVNQKLGSENDLKEQLITRSKTLLLLAGGLIVVFVLLIAALMQNVKRKKKYSKHLLKKNERIKAQQQEVEDQQAELKKQNKRLEELDKTKNKIFSVLTHDLRQPITQVKSVLTLLESEDMSDEERIAIVAKLKESVDTSSNALENLLLWSKKQLTGIHTKIVDVHLLPQVWQLESQIKSNLEAKNLKLQINIPDFFKVKADMNQLDICLRNLVNNAIKFSNPGGTITIQTSESDNYKVISVQDEGVGMDPDQLQKLQDLSVNFSTIGTMNEKGTGLGVLIVHEFMENQNGKLQIKSEKGKGSSFSLLFPKVNKDDSKKSNPES